MVFSLIAIVVAETQTNSRLYLSRQRPSGQGYYSFLKFELNNEKPSKLILCTGGDELSTVVNNKLTAKTTSCATPPTRMYELAPPFYGT